MTRLNTPLDVHDITPTTVRRGPFTGRPALVVTLGPDLDRNYTVRSFLNEIENYNWRSRLTDSGPLLVFDWKTTGGTPSDPLHKKHSDGIVALCNVVSNSTVLVKTPASRVPTDDVDAHIDHFYVELDHKTVEKAVNPSDRRRAPLAWFSRLSRSKSDRTADFLVEASKTSQEDTLQAFSGDFKVPNASFWLVPEGDDVETVSDSLKPVETLVKRNLWNISPRMDLLEADDG